MFCSAQSHRPDLPLCGHAHVHEPCCKLSARPLSLRIAGIDSMPVALDRASWNNEVRGPQATAPPSPGWRWNKAHNASLLRDR